LTAPSPQPTPKDAAPARLPRVLASSVIRGANLGESHGGLYLVDLEGGTADLMLDWNRADIDFEGRGGDRGLRGIAFHGDRILVAANAELLVLDRSFQLLESHGHPCLAHCHEIYVSGDRVYLTSTGLDSLLIFDLDSRRFVEGWHLGLAGRDLVLRRFDPDDPGPLQGNLFHLNSVVARGRTIFFCGLYTPGLLVSDGNSLSLAARLPDGTHNAQPLDGGVVYNDTASDRLCYETLVGRTAAAVPIYEHADILNIERHSSAIARPGFARGLCALAPGLVAAGSSPSTVSVYDLRSAQRLRLVNLSMDVRNAIHGLALWPFD
jgi:hypothetical protein